MTGMNGLDFEEQERRLLAQKRPQLPPHAGEARYQAALDRDRAYREMILMALAIATVVSTGFGQLPAYVGSVRGAMLCLAAGGFAVRATHLRFPRATERTSWTYGPTVRFAAAVLAGFAVAGSILGGILGLISIVFVIGTIGVAMFAGEQSVFRLPIYLIGAVGLTVSTAWTCGFHSGTLSSPGLILGLLLGLAMSAMAILGNLSEPFEAQPTLVVTSFASYAWLVATAPTTLPAVYVAPAIAVACVVVLLVERWLSNRTSFAPVVFAAVIIQLSGYVGVGSLAPRPLTPQVVAMLLEFALLGMAGYRQAVAALARFPVATYRSSPQCLVPALDQAWDHPLRIDAG